LGRLSNYVLVFFPIGGDDQTKKWVGSAPRWRLCTIVTKKRTRKCVSKMLWRLCFPIGYILYFYCTLYGYTIILASVVLGNGLDLGSAPFLTSGCGHWRGAYNEGKLQCQTTKCSNQTRRHRASPANQNGIEPPRIRIYSACDLISENDGRNVVHSIGVSVSVFSFMQKTPDPKAATIKGWTMILGRRKPWLQ